MSKIPYYASLLVILMSFVFMGYSAYLMFYPFKTLEVSHTRVVTKTIKPGETFRYELTYCKYTNAPATVFRTFHSDTDGNIETFPAVQTISILGCNTTIIPLPTEKYIEPGYYYLLVDIVFQLNPFRNEHVIFRTDSFEVVQ